jgi:hypothetical protein
LSTKYGERIYTTQTWNSQRGLSGETAIPRASKIDGTTEIPNIVLHLITHMRKPQTDKTK